MDRKNRNTEESSLIGRIQRGNEAAFEELFFEYYYPLCKFAVKITGSADLARDTIQEVFLKLWRNRESLDLHYSLNAYLYRAVRNQALNLIQQQKTFYRLSQQFDEEQARPEDPYPGRGTGQRYSSRQMAGLVKEIWAITEKIPAQQKLVFELHRKHGLSYQEIAEIMNIARKTVENHMGKALQHIRENLDADRFLRSE